MDFVFRRAVHEDMEGIRGLFAEEFGDRYPHDLVYDPEKLWDAEESGKVISMVALCGGETAAHVALAASPLLPGTMELCMGVVGKEYRNNDLMTRMSAGMTAYAKKIGLYSANSQPVLHHTYAQRICAALGYEACGFIFGITNEGLFSSFEKGYRGSIAAAVKLFGGARKTVFTPECTEETVRKAAEKPSLKRDVAVSDEKPSGTGSSAESYDANLDMASLFINRAGSGSADAIDGFLGRYGGSDVCMAYIDANRPNAGIVEEALDRGFFCIGMFPGSSACDYIMMERTAKPDFRKLKPVPEYAGLLQTIEDSL